MQFLPDALAPLAQYRQFIVYTLIPSKRKPGKWEKLPVDHRTGRMPEKGGGGAHDPSIWTDFPTAAAAAARYGASYGVGFVFTEQDPFWFLDIDGALGDDGQWSQLARDLTAALAGAAVEVSSSGRGLHIIGSGQAPAHAKKNEALHLEFYTERRFVALTGTHATGSAACDLSHLMPSLVHQFFPPRADEGAERDEEWTMAPCDEWRGPTDDDDLIRRALQSTSAAAAFGNHASFRDLWECNVDALAKAYPPDDNGGGTFNASRADAALAQHLAFWTGKDCERILRLMKRSGLVREKWDREDYLVERTIPNAVANQRDVLTDKAPEPVAFAPAVEGQADPSAEAAAAVAVTGGTFLNIDEQVAMFRGCVYVYEQHRVLVPGGMLLKPDQFRVMYGGYSFPMDQANERSTRDAYEAFTQHQAYRSPRSNSTCFKPNMPFGAILEDAGRTRVNMYWPVKVPRTQGDARPFLQHLAKLLPNERDRLILMSYMAACVQHKGTKFQWAPLLQGVEGNGKTLLARCVAEAIGKRYVHWPRASRITAQFNSWLLGRLLYCVEDIYVPGDRIDVIEELKPMITGQDLEIEGKGIDQISGDVCGNFMLNSNHKNALVKTRNDRRFAMFFTAQQAAPDLERDGMAGDYFEKLYGWMRDDGGFTVVSELLHTWAIPDEFNPAGQCQRAPTTSSTDEAIAESRGSVEQEIVEAIAQSTPGFANGWVSSIALGNLLDDLNASRRIPHNRRHKMMEGLGYVLHPALSDGRLPMTVFPDGGKPKLYIRNDHEGRYLSSAEEIARAYTAAQGLITKVPA